MSLFSTIQQSANALQVAQLGLNVVGNNIANANTPGYIRQELIQEPGVATKIGGLLLGSGVRAVGVTQKVDQFLMDRMRETRSQLASSEQLDDIYDQVETLFSELSDSDLSSQLGEFSNSIQDLLNQPGSEALRRMVIERGKSLAGNIQSLHGRLTQLSQGLAGDVRGATTEINRITARIAQINQRIVEMEGGRTSGSDAVGLRDERQKLLDDLSELVDIRAVEQASGSVTVFVGGEYLVSESIQREVVNAISGTGSESFPEIRLADTDSPLQITSGKIHGIYAARSGSIQGTMASLDDFSRKLITEFNKIHSQGQGLSGYSEVTSSYSADDTSGPIDLGGYLTDVENGKFEIQVLDLATLTPKTYTVRIGLNDSLSDSSLEDIRDSIDGIEGLSSEITPEGKLTIRADNENIRFSFQNDDSNFLAAAGINTFFEGDSARNIAVNPALIREPQNFASSLTGVGQETDNALNMARAFDEPVEGLAGRSIKEAFEDIVAQTAQDINVQKGVSDGLRNFYRNLEGKQLAVSGVNLDEEAVKMVFYQRAFQASSRVIQTSSELLETLINL